MIFSELGQRLGEDPIRFWTGVQKAGSPISSTGAECVLGTSTSGDAEATVTQVACGSETHHVICVGKPVGTYYVHLDD